MATQPDLLTPEFEVKQPGRDDDKQDALIARDPLALLQFAVRNNAAIDVIERLAALQREEREYRARVSFDDALSRCQAKLERISADAENPQTRSKYASYAKLDKAVRPVYTAEGFSISFTEADCPIPGKTRFIAKLKRSGVTEPYIKDLTPSTKGPKGQDVMTPIHADASADSYAKRYLLKDIFNIAIGEDDEDGNESSGPGMEGLKERLEYITNAGNPAELKRIADSARQAANAANDTRAFIEIVIAENKRALDFCRTTEEIRATAKPHFEKLRTLQDDKGMQRLTADVEAAKRKVLG